MSNYIHRKPTGKNGPLRVSIAKGTTSKEWNILSLPKNKEDIEKMFFQIFKTKMKGGGAKIISYKRNKQDDFDYELDLPGGKSYLDLAEIIIPKINKIPYKSNSHSFTYQEYVEAVLRIVKEKTQKYGFKSQTPIHLFLYITHWGYISNYEIIFLLQNDLQKLKHSFENIFLLSPLDECFSELRVLFPADLTKYGQITFNINELRKKISIPLNPNKWEIYKTQKE